jgi:hypothetical protein
MLAARKSMLYPTIKPARAKAKSLCKTRSGKQVLTRRLLYTAADYRLALVFQAVTRVRCETSPFLTTDLGIPASNNMENKNRSHPGPWDSERFSASEIGSNLIE